MSIPNLPSRDDIEEIITQKDSTDKKKILNAAKKLVNVAEDLGIRFANSENKKELKKFEVTSTQVRNIYGTVKKMELTGWNEKTSIVIQQQLLLLKPRLAYAAGRHDKSGVKDLKTVLDQAIDFVLRESASEEQKKQAFERFCQFFEAIVAYHKCHGGS